MLMKYLKNIAIIMGSLILPGCDPDGKSKCDWVLEPNPENIKRVDEGYVPVCARNRETMKQDCRLQATLELAKSTTGKKFRYNDMKLEKNGLPKTIKSIKYCTK